ncbi:MAG TPA: tripartite tricarboxylate transporter substrate binding protein [Burkholderiales bacterium]|nr:tripartite tricarboxylate transporter substrate binding protein [Burkholderiales bacterium]
MRFRSFAGGVFALALGAVSSAPAQQYPARPIRMIMPWNPGGTTDTTARILGQKMTETWGQPVVIDTRPGAGGTIGTELAKRAPSDGYTLLHANLSQWGTAPFLYKVSYDTLRDFEPISLVATAPQLLVVTPALNVKSVHDLVQLAKANYGKLNFGSGGASTLAYFGGELFNKLAGVKVVHVPYKGTIFAVTDAMGGRLEMVFSDMPIALPHARAGKLRALAVTGARRTPLVPDMPTVAESGLPGYVLENAWGVLAPKGVPAPIVAKLNAEIVRVHNLQEVKERYAALGLEAVSSTPARFAEMIRADEDKFSRIIRETGARVD